jgi:hypothetical protein
MSTRSIRKPLLCCLLAPVAAFTTFRTEASSLTEHMRVARSGHQATLLLDVRVLVTGGLDEPGTAIGATEMFDPSTGTWSGAHPILCLAPGTRRRCFTTAACSS